MALAMTRPWKHPKIEVYWLRKRVPLKLQVLLGKTEEKRSLGTKDPIKAKVQLAKELATLEEKWANLQKGPVVLSEVEAHQLAQSIYNRWIDRWKDNPKEMRGWNIELGPHGVWDLPPLYPPAHLLWNTKMLLGCSAHALSMPTAFWRMQV